MKFAIKVFLVMLTLSAVTAMDPKWEKALSYFEKYTDLKGIKELNSLSEEKIKEAMRNPIKDIQQEFGIAVDGELNSDMMNELDTPRCGMKDHVNSLDGQRSKRYALLGAVVWPQQMMPLKFGFSNHLKNHEISPGYQRYIALRCAKMWEKGSAGRVRFRPAEFGETPNILISFHHIDGPYNTLGTGLSPVPKSRPPTSYLKLDTGESWVPMRSAGKGSSMLWTICHEMGHNLGLGHSSDERSIMYHKGGRQQGDAHLSQDDINGIRYFYSDRFVPPRPTKKPMVFGFDNIFGGGNKKRKHPPRKQQRYLPRRKPQYRGNRNRGRGRGLISRFSGRNILAGLLG